ncbi:MAG: hypothetical protein ACRC6X_01840 [Culicoidibacterales bacterium]
MGISIIQPAKCSVMKNHLEEDSSGEYKKSMLPKKNKMQPREIFATRLLDNANSELT